MRATILAATTVLVVPTAAGAATPGVELSLQTGFTFPFGRIADAPSVSLSDRFGGFVPFSAELGWRYTPNIFLGLSGTYAIGLTKNCPSGSTCSGHDIAVALEVRYHPLPDEGIDPWFGIGLGYEWLTISGTSSGATADRNFKGVEFIHGQIGVHVLISRFVRAGPFVRCTLGSYRFVADPALHELVTFGMRMSFLL